MIIDNRFINEYSRIMTKGQPCIHDFMPAEHKRKPIAIIELKNIEKRLQELADEAVDNGNIVIAKRYRKAQLVIDNLIINGEIS